MESSNFDYLQYAIRLSQKLRDTLFMVYRNHDHDEYPAVGMALSGVQKEVESVFETLVAVRMMQNTSEDKE